MTKRKMLHETSAAPSKKSHHKKQRVPVEIVPGDDISVSIQSLETMKQQLEQCNQSQGTLITAAQEAAGHLCKRNGIVELEASIGMSNGRISKGWRPELPAFETQLLLTALERGATCWDEVGEWKIFCDTYVVLDKSLTTSTQSQTVRMRSIQGEKSTSITKTLLTRTDFAATGSNIRVRFQAKAERDVATTSAQVILLLPESVRLSLRRTYVLHSRAEPACTYRYTVYRAWTARTSSEAERLMHDDEDNGQTTGQCGVEVEVEVDEKAAPELVMYASLGVLTKIQDLVAVLTGGSRSLRKLSFTALHDDGKTTKLRGQRKA